MTAPGRDLREYYLGTISRLEEQRAELEQRLSVATEALKEWPKRNHELREQNRAKNKRIVELEQQLAAALAQKGAV